MAGRLWRINYARLPQYLFTEAGPPPTLLIFGVGQAGTLLCLVDFLFF